MRVHGARQIPTCSPTLIGGLIVVFQLLFRVQMKSSLQFVFNPTGLESNLRAGCVPVPHRRASPTACDYRVGADHLAARIRGRLRRVAGHITLAKDWL